MFAQVLRLTVTALVAVGAITSAAYASETSPQFSDTNQISDTHQSDINRFDSMRVPGVTSKSATTTTMTPDEVAPMVEVNTRIDVVSRSLVRSVISDRDLELARTPIGARLVAAKLNVTTYRWSEAQLACLDSLWTRESHWGYRANNKRSGAYGIPQARPGSKMASAGADWRTNPITQLKWGMNYVKSRYGNPCKALAKSNSAGWY